ncbi:MAG: hypothetical protein ABL889_01920 [Terricaulis sp.]
MSSSGPKTDKDPAEMAKNVTMKDLTPSGADDDAVRFKLSDLGFKGSVSREALEEIQRHETRANRVVLTAAKFAFR